MAVRDYAAAVRDFRLSEAEALLGGSMDRTVSYLLAREPGSFRALVDAELRARSDDSVGAQLITCARRC